MSQTVAVAKGAPGVSYLQEKPAVLTDSHIQFRTIAEFTDFLSEL